MLSHIGLRIERLLYFGFLLIILCFVEVYLAATAAYFSDSQTRTLDTVLIALQEKKSDLVRAYNAKKAAAIPRNERDLAAAELRKKLGMPPKRADEDPGDKESYLGLLTTIISSIDLSYRRTLPEDIIDSALSPDELISNVKKLIDSNQKHTANILGIETPRELSLKYGSSDFKIPSTYLASALLAVLYLLVVVWIGSFYITRQRELIVIRQAQDHKLSFPHILNWLPVDFSSLPFRNSSQMSKKQQRSEIKTTRIVTAVFRCFLILSIEALILGPLAFSSFTLWHTVMPSDFVTVIGGIFALIICILGINLLLQEAFFLKGKTFYV